MLDHDIYRVPAIVTLPAEIDLTNQQSVYDKLCAALASGRRS